MEESFQLLSTMSPKVKEGYKTTKKVASVLALKKHFRRSSFFDKQVKTTQNDSLIIVESSSSESSSDISSIPGRRPKNEEPIEISDSELSEDEPFVRPPPKRPDFKRNILPELETVTLSRQKIDDIQSWIKKLDIEDSEPKKDVSVYSEVSTIFGDELGDNFKIEGQAYAVNSTQIMSDDKRFDEMFKTREVKKKDESDTVYNFKKGSQEIQSQKNQNKDLTAPDHSMDKLVIEDSFEIKNVQQRRSSGSRKSENVRKSSGNSTVKSGEEEATREYENMLDDLYGTSWRENQAQVLPKSEPRKNIRKILTNIPNTERKPVRNLLPSINQKSNKSPWIQKLKGLCDPDTNSEGSPSKTSPTKKKLNFDNLDEKTSKYFSRFNDDEADKENNLNVEQRLKKKISNTKTPKTLLKTLQTQSVKNNIKSPWADKLKDLCDTSSTSSEEAAKPTHLNFDDKAERRKSKDDLSDFSDLGESLEERIRKKMNNVNQIKTKKVIKKNGKDNLEKCKTPAVEETKNKKKQTKKSTESSSGEDWVDTDDSSEDRGNKVDPQKTSWTFLESLSKSVPINKCDMSARIFRNNFKEYKVQLAEKLFQMYNKEIFDLAIPTNTPIEWNDRMRGTAGFCYCKKITRRNGTIERSVRIALSSKVVDSADRLRDTLVHEMCHAATWLVNNISDGHGPYWKAWAHKSMKRFPELPPIKRCHEYVINTKYTYKCTGCGYSIGRHSKSLDIERKRCGYCLGKFEVLINKTSKQGEVKAVPATPKREPTAFAKFVKENYAQYKTSELKHGDVMKLLGQKFGELKTST